jgi:hypothetical protein
MAGRQSDREGDCTRFREIRPKETLMRRFAGALALLGLMSLFAIGCGKKTSSEPAANSREVTEFNAAVQDGDADIVRRLLQAKPYLANAKNESGQTPLTVAKQKGLEDVANVIQKAGGHE